MIYKMTAEVGLLARRNFETTLKNLCFLSGIPLELFEDRGLLSSNYRIKMTGNESTIQHIINTTKKYLDE